MSRLVHPPGKTEWGGVSCILSAVPTKLIPAWVTIITERAGDEDTEGVPGASPSSGSQSQARGLVLVVFAVL